MLPISVVLTAFTTLAWAEHAAGYKWPQPMYDELEDLLVVTHGVGTSGLITEIDREHTLISVQRPG